MLHKAKPAYSIEELRKIGGFSAYQGVVKYTINKL